MFLLRENTRIRFRDRLDQIRSDQGPFPKARRGNIAREPVQVHTKAEHASPFLDAKLRRQAGKDSSEHVARYAGRHSRTPGCVDVGIPGGRRKNGMKAFEDYMRAPAARRF